MNSLHITNFRIISIFHLSSQSAFQNDTWPHKNSDREPELGRHGAAPVSFPITPVSPTGHSEKPPTLPRDGDASEWDSVSFGVLQTWFYLNSLQSLERVGELTAVSAELFSVHPWLHTSFKCKRHLSWGDQRVTNHYPHTKLQLLHHLLYAFLFVPYQ